MAVMDMSIYFGYADPTGDLFTYGFIGLMIALAFISYQWRMYKIKQALGKAGAKDATWDKALEQAKAIYNRYPADWTNADLASLKTYVTPQYFAYISLVFEALQQLDRRNLTTVDRILAVSPYNVHDDTNNREDSFDVEFNALRQSELRTASTNTRMYHTILSDRELWHFERIDDQWKLDRISRGNEDAASKSYATMAGNRSQQEQQHTLMRDFAKANGFYYDQDFGWILLPQGGHLFTVGFSHVAVTNHVIGRFQNMLVQFYQMYNTSGVGKITFVAQTTLPKSYGHIIVRHKSLTTIPFDALSMSPVHLEGVSFDKKYAVYASDMERVTSLELLHPAYMERLLALPFMVNIEIMGNALYLYSTDDQVNPQTMLELIHAAFEEMKM